jgi:hypothetical protein
MRKVASRRLVLAAGLAALVLPSNIGVAATGEGDPRVSEVSAARTLGDAADLTLRFVQEDGPESGHVRVELTPEVRPLTFVEARMAAEKGFLAALNEPGLGDNLTRITVVVKLMPASHPSPDMAEQVIVYRHKGGHDWSITAGE